ncbi:MAG: hypothetical protein ABJD97_21880 [Betaproteobacteria bacterium]
MTFSSLIRARWLPLLLAPLLAFAALEARADLTTKPGEYGKTLLVDVVLPPSQLDKFQNFKPSKADPNESKMLNALSADAVDWFGDTVLGNSTTNPYTLVVSIEGTAKADGDIATMWRTGWKLDDGSTKIQLLPGLAKTGVKAGQRVTMTRAAAPYRFDKDKNVAPMLSLVRADNVVIDHIQVQLWSGMGSPTGLQWFMNNRLLMVGLAMVVVALVFRKL